MSETLLGWILFAALLITTGLCSFGSTTLILSAFGKRERKSVRYMLVCISLSMASVALSVALVWVEPKPI